VIVGKDAASLLIEHIPDGLRQNRHLIGFGEQSGAAINPIAFSGEWTILPAIE
jgi:hypothetical protein